MDYWKELISEAFEDAGILATDEQKNIVASWAEGAHQNYGMAFPTPENPLKRELSETQELLRKEKAKQTCEKCNGGGRIVTLGPYHSSDSECYSCRGEGRK